MLVYISQMVPYFSLFDTFMDQTSDRSSEPGWGWYTALAASLSRGGEKKIISHFIIFDCVLP